MKWLLNVLKGRWLGHPLHPILVHIPMAMWPGTREIGMIREIKSGYRLYSRKKSPKTGKRRNLGPFKTKAAAKRHEKAVQYFKRRQL